MRITKNITILMLTLILALAFSSVVLADILSDGSPIELSLSQPTQEEINKAKEKDFKNITVLRENDNEEGDFTGLEWVNQSTYAEQDVTTKYKTRAITFRIGEYFGYNSSSIYFREYSPPI